MPQATQAKPWLETLDTPALRLVAPVDSRSVGDLDVRAVALKREIRKLLQIEKLEARRRQIERRLGYGIPAHHRRRLEWIKSAVLARFDLTDRELHADTRRVEIVWPRHVCFYLARRLTNASLTMIGGWLRRDHATVSHSVRAVEARMQTEPQSRAEVEALEAQLRSQLEAERPAHASY